VEKERGAAEAKVKALELRLLRGSSAIAIANTTATSTTARRSSSTTRTIGEAVGRKAASARATSAPRSSTTTTPFTSLAAKKGSATKEEEEKEEELAALKAEVARLKRQVVAPKGADSNKRKTEEVARWGHLEEVTAAAAGHTNLKQRIHHVTKLKEEVGRLSLDNRRLDRALRKANTSLKEAGVVVAVAATSDSSSPSMLPLSSSSASSSSSSAVSPVSPLSSGEETTTSTSSSSSSSSNSVSDGDKNGKGFDAVGAGTPSSNGSDDGCGDGESTKDAAVEEGMGGDINGAVTATVSLVSTEDSVVDSTESESDGGATVVKAGAEKKSAPSNSAVDKENGPVNVVGSNNTAKIIVKKPNAPLSTQHPKKKGGGGLAGSTRKPLKAIDTFGQTF
jgi:hypothetical protein